MTLGDSTGEGIILHTPAVVPASGGGFFLSHDAEPGRVLSFGDDGGFLGFLGRSGEGPGEFRRISALASAPDGSLYVFDRGLARVTVYDIGGAYGETVRLPLAPGSVNAAVILAGGDMLLAGRLGVQDRVACAVHFVSAAGEAGRSYACDPDGFDPRTPERYERRIARGDDSTFWAAGRSAYRLERWHVRGSLEQVLTRDVPWFRPWTARGPISPEGGRVSELTSLGLDPATGLLWVLIRVPSDDPEWVDGLISETVPSGRTYYGVGDASRVYDTVIEAVDPATGQVVATRRVDPAFEAIVAPGLALSYAEDEVGNPFVQLWRLELTGR